MFSYQVCIRPEAGACCVQYQVCSDQTNAFTLGGGGDKKTMSVLDENCPSVLNPATTLLALDYIEILGKLMQPEGHSTMDNALACHTGGPGSNPVTTKVYSAPILSGIPAMCTLSHNACPHLLLREYLSQGR